MTCYVLTETLNSTNSATTSYPGCTWVGCIAVMTLENIIFVNNNVCRPIQIADADVIDRVRPIDI